MKYVTASEARQNWFRLLDEVIEGEVIAIQRDDKKLILKLAKTKQKVPDYRRLINFKDADAADTWGWDWKGPRGLIPVKRKRKR